MDDTAGDDPGLTRPFSRFVDAVPAQDPLRAAVTAATRRAEADCVMPLVPQARLSPEQGARARDRARQLVLALRAHRAANPGGVDALLQEFSLSTREGVALMCLAEA